MIDWGISTAYFPAMIKKLFFSIALMLMFTLSSAFSQEKYSWPLKLTPELTSKFCDYRAGHFHSGLDIRTGGQIGVPVYAVDDGYVWRVAMSFSQKKESTAGCTAPVAHSIPEIGPARKLCRA